jgi:Flp pilus assembly protein TadD
LEPNSYLHLNDLGYSLLQAGQYDEAETVLKRAMELAPPEYDLAKGNLEHLRKVRSEHP